MRTDAKDQSWTVGNALVERQITFDPTLGLYTASWRHKLTGTDFVVAGRTWRTRGREFSFVADGGSLDGSNGSDWEFVQAKTQAIPASRQSLVIDLRAKSKPVEVSIVYASYPSHPVIRKWIAVTNRSGAPVTLTHLSFESVSLASAPPDVLQASGFYAFEPRELFFTGRVDDTAVLEGNSLATGSIAFFVEGRYGTKRDASGAVGATRPPSA